LKFLLQNPSFFIKIISLVYAGKKQKEM